MMGLADSSGRNVLMDISDRKRAEEVLAQALQAKTEFHSRRFA